MAFALSFTDGLAFLRKHRIAMQFDQILYHVENAPSLKLLRHEYGAFALSFFASAFKQTHRVQIDYQELVHLLDGFMTEQQETGRLAPKTSARHTIDQWCDDRHRFVRKYYEADGDEPVTELTYETEQALEWILSLDRREFVGAQSRFLGIFADLNNLAQKGDNNPKARIKHLQKERDRLDKEIGDIKRTGRAPVLDRVEIKERFLKTVDEIRRLIADFRLIEDIFKNLTRDIKTAVLKATTTKGAILGQVLDIHDQLEKSDQGKSFRAFWNFLMSPEKQAELKTLTLQVLELDEVKEYNRLNAHRGHSQTLLTLKNQLLQVGRKVLISQSRLSKELRRLLHHDNLIENKQVTSIIAAIKRLCLLEREAFAAIASDRAVDLELAPQVHLPLERPLWRPKEETRFADRGSLLADSSSLLPTTFEGLGTGAGIRVHELEERIASLLKDHREIALTDLIATYPIAKGCAEIIAYLSLALDRPEHQVNCDEQTNLSFVGPGGRGLVLAPQVTFRRPRDH